MGSSLSLCRLKMEYRSINEITFSIYTLGCKLNQAEENYISDILIKENYRHISYDNSPDIFILNSCTVTNRARYKSLSMIRRIKRTRPDTVIVLMGCIPQTEPNIQKDLNIDLILDNDQKKDIVKYIQKLKIIKKGSGPAGISKKERNRANLIIQTGCDSKCSYCIIPQARGPARSVPLRDILDNLKDLHKRGYKEIILTGIHISRYKDYQRDSTRKIRPLEELIEAIFCLSSDFRIRLSSIEPADIDDKFIDFILSNKRICRHLHIPLQHISDKILNLMNRKYSNSYIIDLIEMIHDKSKDIQIGSDIITGFPQEDIEDFDNLCNTINRLPISHLHIFPFSKRKNTPAFSLKGQIPNSIKKERSKILQNIGKEKKSQFILSQINKDLEIIILNKISDNKYNVLTDNYISGILNTEKDISSGSLIFSKLIEYCDYTPYFQY